MRSSGAATRLAPDSVPLLADQADHSPNPAYLAAGVTLPAACRARRSNRIALVQAAHIRLSRWRSFPRIGNRIQHDVLFLSEKRNYARKVKKKLHLRQYVGGLLGQVRWRARGQRPARFSDQLDAAGQPAQ